jgi:hypothetical protein
MQSGWHHGGNRVRLAIQLDNPANNGAVGRELAPPQPVTQNHMISIAKGFIFRTKIPA